MKKFKELLKENKFVLLTPIIATSIFIIVYIIKSIIPFGKNTLLAVDFYHQYGPLLSEFYDRVKSGASLTYSYQTGLGLPYFRNFFNYLSSPFNIILFLFKRDNIVTAFSFIIALKIITASTTMAYALKKFFNKNNLLVTAFGISYAFSTYFVAFYWNIMWLDGLIYLPLITLGIKNLIDNNKQNLYIISLAIAIISNYFIGYMLCIYSCIFFLIYLIFNTKITRKELLKKLGLFTLSSLLSGGIVAVMLIPYITSLSTISATGDKFAFAKNFYFNPIYFLANHYSTVKTIVFSSQDYFLPNVSSGILVFIFTILFFFNKEIKKSHKICAITLILILFISFIYLPLDFIWHGFHTPNDLPFRYSFIYVFILNGIAFYSATKMDKLKIFIPIIPTIILSIFGFYLFKTKFLTYEAFMINLIFITASFIIIVFFNKKYYLFGNILCLVLTTLNILLNISTNWDINHDKNVFMDNYIQMNGTINRIKEQDKDFYRIEKNATQTLNDGAWYNYNGVSIFSSVAYEKMTKAQKKLGLPSNNVNSYYYRQNTPIYNGIMSIRYLINPVNNSSYAEYMDEINFNTIFKNKYYLPIAFATNETLKDWEPSYNNPFYNQEEFVNKATGVQNIFEQLDVSKLNAEDNFDLNEKQLQYFGTKTQTVYLKTKAIEDANVYIYVYNYYLEHFVVNGEYYFITKNEPYILDVGYYSKDSDIYIEIPLNKDTKYIDLYLYQINQEKFETYYNYLNQETIELTKFTEEKLEGTITTSDNKIIFTSIPYDEGFEVYVDDKKIECYPIANAFLGFDITEGTHKIKIIYKVPKFKLGLIISIISICGFVLLNKLKKKSH